MCSYGVLRNGVKKNRLDSHQGGSMRNIGCYSLISFIILSLGLWQLLYMRQGANKLLFDGSGDVGD